MVTRPFLDLVPKNPTREQLTRPDRMLTGTITEVTPAGMVEVALEGSDDPPVIVPIMPGVAAVGAIVQLQSDSSGRITQAVPPLAIPMDADPVYIGATGQAVRRADMRVERLEAFRAEIAEALAEKEAALDALREQLAAAEADMDEARATLTDLNEVAIPLLDEQLSTLGELPDIDAAIDDALAKVGRTSGEVVTSGPPPTNPVIGRTIWVAPNGAHYRAVECEEKE